MFLSSEVTMIRNFDSVIQDWSQREERDFIVLGFSIITNFRLKCPPAEGAWTAAFTAARTSFQLGFLVLKDLTDFLFLIVESSSMVLLACEHIKRFGCREMFKLIGN